MGKTYDECTYTDNSENWMVNIRTRVANAIFCIVPLEAFADLCLLVAGALLLALTAVLAGLSHWLAHHTATRHQVEVCLTLTNTTCVV